jgi:hypothetical protein
VWALFDGGGDFESAEKVCDFFAAGQSAAGELNIEEAGNLAAR